MYVHGTYGTVAATKESHHSFSDGLGLVHESLSAIISVCVPEIFMKLGLGVCIPFILTTTISSFVSHHSKTQKTMAVQNAVTPSDPMACLDEQVSFDCRICSVHKLEELFVGWEEGRRVKFPPHYFFEKLYVLSTRPRCSHGILKTPTHGIGTSFLKKNQRAMKPCCTWLMARPQSPVVRSVPPPRCQVKLFSTLEWLVTQRPLPTQVIAARFLFLPIL